MRKLALLALLLTFALSGCASVPSGDVKCPVLQPVPASLMQPPSYGQKARAILLETQTPQTQKSGDSKKS
jgi:starvation-inducible outer membrane lipoprotein